MSASSHQQARRCSGSSGWCSAVSRHGPPRLPLLPHLLEEKPTEASLWSKARPTCTPPRFQPCAGASGRGSSGGSAAAACTAATSRASWRAMEPAARSAAAIAAAACSPSSPRLAALRHQGPRSMLRCSTSTSHESPDSGMPAPAGTGAGSGPCAVAPSPAGWASANIRASRHMPREAPAGAALVTGWLPATAASRSASSGESSDASSAESTGTAHTAAAVEASRISSSAAACLYGVSMERRRQGARPRTRLGGGCGGVWGGSSCAGSVLLAPWQAFGKCVRNKRQGEVVGALRGGERSPLLHGERGLPKPLGFKYCCSLPSVSASLRQLTARAASRALLLPLQQGHSIAPSRRAHHSTS